MLKSGSLFNRIKSILTSIKERNPLRFSIITKYILKEFIPTFIIAFLFFFVIFFINQILLEIKDLLLKQVPFNLILGIMVNSFPLFILLSLPFATMLSTLMIMGRLSTDNEIVAFRALGFSMMQVFKPVFIISVFISFTDFVVYDFFLPLSLKERINIQRQILAIRPTLNFSSKTIEMHEKKAIYTDIVNNQEIQGIIIIDKSGSENKILLASTAGIYSVEDRPSAIELRLNNAMVQTDSNERPGEFNYGYADKISYYISFIETNEDGSVQLPAMAKTTRELFEEFQSDNKMYIVQEKNLDLRRLRAKYDIMSAVNAGLTTVNRGRTEVEYLAGLSAVDNNLRELIELSKERVMDSSYNYTLIELLKKFAYPISCMVFALFAAPVGIYSRRAGFQIGFILGLFLSAFYWFAFFSTDSLGKKMILSPVVAMFLPNFVFTVLGTFFLIKRIRE